jgi:carboxyl-terminal processing protease
MPYVKNLFCSVVVLIFDNYFRSKRMNSKIWQPFIYALLIASGMLIGIWLKPGSSGGGFIFSTKSKIGQLINIIDQAYVDPVNIDSVEEVTISGLLTQLDPHSIYIPAKELQQANEGLEGNFEGVGIEFSILNDTILVANAIADGPSARAGIKPGDRIIRVDSTPVAGVNINNERVFKLLRGPKGTRVQVVVYRPDAQQKLSFTIARGTIPINSVEAALMLNNETGYIKIDKFAANTHEEFINALTRLQTQHMKNLVLDLRGNPGGYLSAATAIADEFLDDNKLIVYTQGRNQGKIEYKAENEGYFEHGKLVVLVDEGSASASEIVSGAIQDWDRGVIVGRRSFGKGLVQEPFTLNDGSVVRLTVSRYYTPSGRCIQKDYTHGYEAYEHEINARYEDGEVKDSTRQRINDSTVFRTAKGRIVYSGGGISPDVFVSVDTSYLNDFYTTLFTGSLLSRFAYNYVDQNRKQLIALYASAAAYTVSYNVDHTMWNNFVSFISQNSKKPFSQAEISASEKQAKLMLKAFIARQLWRDEGYYTVLNGEDRIVRKALETLRGNYDDILN